MNTRRIPAFALRVLADDIDRGRIKYDELNQDWKTRLSSIGYQPKPATVPTPTKKVTTADPTLEEKWDYIKGIPGTLSPFGTAAQEPAPAAAPQPSFIDKVGQTVQDNPLLRALSIASTSNILSQAEQGLLKKAGVPESPLLVQPRNTFEKALQVGSGLATDAAIGGAALKAAAPIVKPVLGAAGKVTQPIKNVAQKALELAQKAPTGLKVGGGILGAAAAVDTGVGAFTPNEQAGDRSFFEKTGASLRAGTGDVLSTLGNVAKWQGADKLGESLTAKGEAIREGYEQKPVEFTWKSLLDPNFYSTNVARSLPLTASLVPAMIAGYKGTGAAVAKTTLKPFQKAILSSLGGAAVSRPIESALEAGSTYEDMLAKGKTPEEANEAANSVFKKNLSLVGLDAAQLAAAFAPTPFKAASKAGKIALGAGRIGADAVMEAGEEGIQDIFQRQATGQPIAFDSQMQEAMAIGGLMGAGMGGAGAISDVYKHIQDRTIESLPEVKAQVEQEVSQGAPREEVVEKALDALAETEEGQQVISDIVNTVNEEVKSGKLQLALPAGNKPLQLYPGALPEAGTQVEQKTEQIQPVVTQKAPTGDVGEPVKPLTPEINKSTSKPIEDRSFEEVGNRKVKAYQYEHPELREYIKTEAEILLQELKDTVKGQRFSTVNEAGERINTGTSRLTSAPLERIMEATKATYAEIADALNRIIYDQGHENTALAKRIELVIDDNLTNGRKLLDGTAVPSNEEYIAIKNKIEGKETVAQSNQSLTDEAIDSILDGNQASIVATPKKAPSQLPVEPRKKEGQGVPSLKTGNVQQGQAGEAQTAVTGQEATTKPANSESVKDEDLKILPGKTAASTKSNQPTSTLADYNLSLEQSTTKNGNTAWAVKGDSFAHKDILKRLGARWYKPHPKAKGVWTFYGEDPTSKILAKLPPLEKKEAQQETKQPQSLKIGRAGKATYQKWGKNEYVNANLEDESNPYTQAFKRFFEFYYNAGLNNDKRKKVFHHPEIGEYNFPSFLEDEFFRAGQKDNEAALKRQESKKPAEATDTQPSTQQETAKPDIDKLKTYAKDVTKTGEIKSVTLVGSTAAKGAGNDIDLLYDLGDIDLPADSNEAAEQIESIIENMKAPIDIDIYDTFIKVGDRYFHLSSGAGREIVENTEYAKEQAGKSTVVLAKGKENIQPTNTRKPSQKPETKVESKQEEPAAQTKSDKMRAWLQNAEKDARARLKERQGRVLSGLPMDDMLDYTIIGASKLAVKAMDLAEFTKAMLDDIRSDFGEKAANALKNWLPGIYAQSQHMLDMDPEEVEQMIRDAAKDKEASEDEAKGNTLAGNTESGRPEKTSKGSLEGTQAENVSGPSGKREAEEGDRRGGTDNAGDGKPDTGRVKGEEPASENKQPAGDDGVSQLDTKDILGDGEGGKNTTAGRGKRTEPVARHNFTFTKQDRGGVKTKAKDNLAAIRLLKQLEAENRLATPEEQKILARYVGWGGVKGIFRVNLTEGEEWYNEQQQLKELLTEEEYKFANDSVLNAHYTSAEVVEAMWGVLKRFGFKGGRILEPSMGTGRFFGFMPKEVMGSSKLTGIELDQVTGRIARQLFQKADIRIQGFQDFIVPDNYYDLVISNVPFSGNPVRSDKKYEKYKFNLHNYFFAKSMDKVRPGGLIAFITGSGTMQAGKDAQALRELIATQADLIGAVRLPSSAFKESANTEVTTDIIILQKREPGAEPKGESWAKVDGIATVKNSYGYNTQVRINEYYGRHPEMMLGTVADDKLHPGRAALQPDGRDIKKALTDTFKKFPKNIYADIVKPETQDLEVNDYIAAPDAVNEGAFILKDGKLMQKKEGLLVTVAKQPKVMQRIKGMIGIRDAARDLLRLQRDKNITDEQLKPALAKLNRLYDAFVKKHGPLSNERTNVSAFREDQTGVALLMALEIYDKKTDTAVKANIFKERTISPVIRVAKADNAKEALIVSLNETGKVNLERITELTGGSTESITEELKGLIYLNPETGLWETKEEYLSGNVRDKLVWAATAAEAEPRYKDNVEALKAVQPEDIQPEEIYVRLGAPWVSSKHIEDFVNYLFKAEEGQIKVSFAPAIGTWKVDTENHSIRRSTVNESTWGTEYAGGLELLEDGLNLRTPTVTYEDANGKRVTHPERTMAAQEKLEAIKEEFQKWIWADKTRTEELTRKYNDIYNNIRLREYDGSHINPPGLAKHITLRPHQKNGIWRIIQGGNTLLAHSVGAGKTWTMQVAGMELKRLGIIKKPLYVLPNNLLKQFVKEFYEAYPGANLLVIANEDLPKVKPDINKKEGETEKSKSYINRKAANSLKRKTALNRVVTGNWDGIIMTYTTFQKMPVSPEYENAFIREQIQEVERAIIEAKAESGDDKGNRIVTELANARQRLEEQLTSDIDSARKDMAIPFEELGIDQIFVDEADNFKNLYYTSKMNRIAGLPRSKSKRAMDMFMKTQWLYRHTNGRGVVFATGTPISNTMAEMYTMTRYLANDMLKDRNVANFDNWAATFGEAVTGAEMSPDGSGFRMNTRFAQFINAPELIQMFRSFTDIQSREHLTKSGYIKVPKVKSETITSPKSNALHNFIQSLSARTEAIRSGRVDPKDDNMLKITGEGRKAALDIRLVLPSEPEDPNSKVNIATRKIYDIWERTKENRSTQLVFCDISTPKGSYEAGDKKPKNMEEAEGRFKEEEQENVVVYHDIKRKLIEAGIPEKEIAFIHDAKNDKQKLTLVEKVRTGEVRVLIGSTEKMGAGMNAQNLLIAEHHLDAPWRPRDIEQREGRIIRQGNKNPEVEIYRYVTEGSFDVFMWQTLEAKARFISQAMSDDITSRTLEDVEALVLTFAQVKAIATGNPKIMEKVVTDSEVKKLEVSLKSYQAKQRKLSYDLKGIPDTIKYYEDKISAIKQDISNRQDTSKDKFKIKLGKINLTDRKQAQAILDKLADRYRGLSRKKSETVKEKIGELAGFDLIAEGSWFESEDPTITISGEYEYGASFSIQGMEKVIRNTPEREIGHYKERIEGQQKELAEVKEEIKKPWEHEEKYKRLKAKQRQLDIELGAITDPNGGQSIDDIVEEVVKEAETNAGVGAGRRGSHEPPGRRKQSGLSLGNVQQRILNTKEDVQAMYRPSPPPTSKGTATGTIRRKDIIKFLEAKFAPIRTGRYRGKSLGIFKIKPEVIRTRLAHDLPVIAHEVGHYLDKRLNLANPAYDNELIKLGHPQSRKDYTQEQIRKEGVAEFMRLYLTDPQGAKQEAPNYYAAFENILEVHPDIKDVLQTTQRDIELWYTQPAEARVAGAISVGDKGTTRKMSLDRLYSLTIDEILPLKKFVEQMGVKGLPIEQDPYKLAWLARGWSGKAETLLHRGVLDQNGNKIGKSLDEVLKPVKNELDAFRNYAVAKHSLEVTAQGKHTGIMDADAQEVVNNAPAKYQDVLEDLVEYQDALLDLLIDSGVMDYSSKLKMRQMYQNYVPFYRVFDEDLNTVAAYMSKGGFANLRNPVKTMKGSTREIVDPIESIIKNTYIFANVAERNNVGRSIVELAESKDGTGQFVEKVDAQHNVAKENILTVYRNGKAEKFQLDPDLYRATLALDRESANMVVKILSYPASWLRAGATLSPDFMVRNPLRDQFSAFINSKYGYIPGYDLVKGIFHAIKKDDMYWLFQNSGAAHSTMVALDRDYLQNSIKEFIGNTTTKEKIITVVNPKTYIEMLRALSELGEYGTRLGEFSKGTKKGANPLEAALSARDLTLDFARVGTHMKQMNRIIAFMNAAIQGMDKMGRQFKAHPAKTTLRVALSITLPSVLLWLANHDDDRYKELPQWQKDMFWIVLTKNHIFRVPKPFELGILFGTVPERILTWAYEKDPKAFKELGKTIGDAFLPGYIPTALLPIIETWANKSFFTNRPIVPEREKYLEPKYQFGSYTTETAKAIGDVLNWSPRKIENFIRGYTGGLGMYTIKMAEGLGEVTGAMGSRNKPALPTAGYPVLKSFMVEPYESSQSVQDFYDELNTLEKKSTTAKQTKQVQLTKQEEGRLKSLRKVADKLSDIRKTEREIETSKTMTSDQKKAALERSKMLMVNLTRGSLGKTAVR